jgi:hypothetical protein
VILGGAYRLRDKNTGKDEGNRGMLNNFGPSMHKDPGNNFIGFSARIIDSMK